MSRSTDVIDRVLATTLLIPELLTIPAPASAAEIDREEARLVRGLSAEHRSILERWNGLNLDVLRVYGCAGTNEAEIGSLVRRQVREVQGIDLPVAIGSDPSGFLFIEGHDGSIWSLDSEDETPRRLSRSFGEFLEVHVFGGEAGNFGGDDWLAEVRDAGLIR